jgi:hypothetical protein
MSSSFPPRRPITIAEQTKELGAIIAGMNVPQKHRNLSDLPTLLWLGRKLEVGNPEHPELARAMALLRQVTEYHTTKAGYDSGRMPERRSGFDRRAPKSGP